MKRRISILIDFILILVFCTFIFTTIHIMPIIWYVLSLVIGESLFYLPDILLAFVFIILLFYTACVKKQTKISSYICFMVLSISTYLIYLNIKGPYNKMHLFEYFIVSILFFKLFRHYITNLKLYILVIILSALTGLFDESLQFFVLSRDCSLGDLR
ncbi:MAG: VanZ family protein, partial [Candidatus Omnitrophica bacterium]|nr:VanZ family protein [Candidatus Omnitrophota bacterium]